MKKFLLMLILLTGLLPAKWYQLRVPLTGDVVPSSLAGFDIVYLKPGLEARLVVTDEELSLLDKMKVPYEILIEDMQAYYASRMQSPSNFGNYYTYSEANLILDSLHQRYPGIMSERAVLPNDESDTTWDGNYVWAVKISDNVGTDEDEPEVLYTGLHHAREPIGVNICVEWARWLCENYGSNPLATYLVDNREIWIVPMVNPDGYLYNEETDPGGGGMHRKNRRPVEGNNEGVDINRNYPYMWGYDDEGSSPLPFMDSYRGPDAGSEPETQSVMALCKDHEFITALNFHSFSNLFLYPWGYINERCPDSSAFYGWGEVSTRISRFSVISGYELYTTNGDSDDWMYGETGDKNRIFSVTPEVGEDFWQEWQIDQHIEETHPTLEATAKAAGVYPEIEWLAWSDNADGNLSPGETVDLLVGILNMSVRDASGEIELELSTSNPKVDLVKSTSTIPSLGPQTSGTNEADPLRVKLAADADSTIFLTLTVRTSTEGFVHTAILPVGNRDTLIWDDFEELDSTLWQSNFALTTEEAHSGDHSITDSPAAEYADNRIYYLESLVPFNLSDKAVAELCFWHRFSIEKGFDWAALEVKNDDTGDWVTLKHWSGEQAQWREEHFDLSDYCGADGFKIRFTLTTDQGLHLDGWYIDDVALTAFKGQAPYGGLHELTTVRPVIKPLENITTGTLSFASHSGTPVQIRIFDASGREVGRTEGVTPFSWQMRDGVGRALPAGVYFVQTTYENGGTRHKVVLFR